MEVHGLEVHGPLSLKVHGLSANEKRGVGLHVSSAWVAGHDTMEFFAQASVEDAIHLQGVIGACLMGEVLMGEYL